MLEQAVILGLFDRAAMDAQLMRSNGRRGIKMLQRLLADLPDDPAPVASELERRFYALVRRAGLPLPVVNGHIGAYQVDFHWPKQRLAVETDGRTNHDNPIAFARDRRRDLDLELAGWHVLRFGWREVVGDPGAVVKLLTAHLTERGESI